MKILEQIDDYISEIDVDLDEELFDRMVDFIVSLDPDQLSEEQLEIVMDIIEDFEFEDQEDVEENMSEVRYLKKTTRKERREAKIYRRKNKAKIKAWRRRNKAKLKRAKKTGRGLTGKRRGLFKRKAGSAAAT